MTRVLAIVVTVLALGSRASAEPTELTLEVVDVAGDRAYLVPGEAAGVRAGDTARFDARSFKVTAVYAAGAVIELRGASLRRGARGRVKVSSVARESVRRLTTPHPLESFQGQWPKPALPASSQHPKPVPLGPIAADGGTRVALSVSELGSVPLASPGSPWVRGELRARVLAEPIRELPLRIDADVALALWFSDDVGDDTRASRPLVRVRALEVAYGRDSGYLAAAGRLRYAARTIGMLDGVKAQAPLYGGLVLAAFGGIVPDPLTGKPSTDAARFGAELAWEDLATELRPRVALTAQASHFDGSFDERRLNAFVDVFPGRSHAGAYATLSLFDRDNPWNAAPQELSAAGASTTTRFGDFELGARLDMQRPERSRWLDSFLPQGFFCTRSVSNSCRRGDARLLGQVDVGLRKERWAVTLGATGSHSVRIDADQLGGFITASVLRIAEVLHLDTSLMGQSGSLLQSGAVSVGGGTLLWNDRLDVGVHYRPALTRYRADTGTFLEHSVGADALVDLGSNLDFSLTADAIAGRDLSVLLVQSLLSWRPRAF